MAKKTTRKQAPKTATAKPKKPAAAPTPSLSDSPPRGEKPTGKPTRAELTAEKVEFVRSLFAESQPFGKIKKAFALKFNCAPRSAEPFYKLAKEQCLKEFGCDSVDEMRGMSTDFYLKMAGDMKAPLPMRLRARENIDRLYGLNAPVKVAPTNAAGQDLPPEGRRLTIAELDVELAKFDAGKEDSTGEGEVDGAHQPPPSSSSSENLLESP